MPKDYPIGTEYYAYTQNRELSWLRFNQRVLEEADDRTNPVLERLKFVSIFSSNLDEFFMVRVGSLFDVSLMSPSEIDSKSGMTPAQQLDRVYRTVSGLIELKKQIYASVVSDLSKQRISDLQPSELSASEQKFINRYVQSNILPILSPIIIGSHHPVPHLTNKSLYISALLKDKKGKYSVGFVPVPESLPPYVKLPGPELRFLRTENIVLQWAPTLFGSYQATETCVLCVTRNADLSFDEEKFEDNEDDFRARVTKLLKKRDSLSVVRLELNQEVSDAFLEKLTSLIPVENRQIYFDSCPLNMKYVFQLAGELPEEKADPLLYVPYQARWPEDISREIGMIEQIQQKDKLLFYPFDSVEPFLRLLSEAAERPDVISIKITIYRLASSSKIARILCRAAENGKEVIVLMELRARFDEANNVAWSKLLEDAGCQVVYGIEDFKCHSKICLITLRGRGKLNYITQIGTGNYNEKTNAMYTDLTVMTASEAIGEDGAAFFRNMLINNLEGEYSQLLVSPNGIKAKLYTLIDEQIAKGSQGYVCIKANSVAERGVIDKLMAASRAGVHIQLIIRGICCILPGVQTFTDNIEVTSIVGRFLEHARIYCFGKGSEATFYISSADLMTRNLARRVEIACPIQDPDLREQLEQILSCQLRDNQKASLMMPDGVYERKSSQTPMGFDCQRQFMAMSLHKPATYAPVKQRTFERIRAFFHRILGGR
ncbi:MAG: polyphosphate kinase 1 [Oscillospiraceae bacterium]|nr:polyphosphate kinase 1 [Oscillospiraceae bacterium]